MSTNKDGQLFFWQDVISIFYNTQEQKHFPVHFFFQTTKTDMERVILFKTTYIFYGVCEEVLKIVRHMLRCQDITNILVQIDSKIQVYYSEIILAVQL